MLRCVFRLRNGNRCAYRSNLRVLIPEPGIKALRFSELRAEKIDNRNFAFDTYYPTPNQIQLAEQRARKYWAKHAERFGSNPFYLAVLTSKIFAGDVQGLSPKLNHSETTASNRRRSYSYLEIKGVMIFDIRTGHFVGNMGFMSVDTPPLGGLARYDHYIARYIGFGNWP